MGNLSTLLETLCIVVNNVQIKLRPSWMTFLYYERVSLTPWMITRASIKLSYFIANRILAEEDFI
jgi:hypothetical protein